MNNSTFFDCCRNIEASLVCVKSMVFQRVFNNGYTAYATVLCCVPEGKYGEVKIGCYDNKPHPESPGTFIRAIGFGLISPNNIIPLTRYEEYLKKEGWEFVTTVKSARGKTQKEAFEISRLMINIIKSLRNKTRNKV